MVETHPAPARSEHFTAAINQIGRLYFSDVVFVFRRPENWVRRRLGLAYDTIGASVVMGLASIILRASLALLATALAADWAQVNWAGWAIVLAFFAFIDGVMRMASPPPDEPLGSSFQKMLDDVMGLLRTVSREADIDDLAAFARRWIRLSTGVTVGAVVTITTLGTAWFIMPDAFGQVAAGTIVLVAMTLLEFGSVTVTPVDWALITRESRYDHDLFWASPADSPEVSAAMSTNTGFGFLTGLWMTFYMILTIMLVGWRSPLVLPIAAGFTVFGYITVILTTFGIRGSIERIVERARERQLAPLRRRIADLEPRSADLSAADAEQLRNLLEVYSAIRDAPGARSATHTLLHTAAGLLVPTIMFLISVSGEVYAERILDTILP